MVYLTQQVNPIHVYPLKPTQNGRISLVGLGGPPLSRLSHRHATTASTWYQVCIISRYFTVTFGSDITLHQAAIEGLSSVGAVTISTASVVNSTAFAGRTGNVVAGSPYVTASADVSSVLSQGDWLRLCDATDGLVRIKSGMDLHILTDVERVMHWAIRPQIAMRS